MNNQSTIYIPGPVPPSPSAISKYQHLLRTHEHLLGLLISNPAFAPNLTSPSTANSTNPPSTYPAVQNKQTHLFEFIRRTRSMLENLDPAHPDRDGKLWDEINARAVYTQWVLDEEMGVVDFIVDGKVPQGRKWGTMGGVKPLIRGEAQGTDCEVRGNGFTGAEVLAGRVLGGSR